MAASAASTAQPRLILHVDMDAFFVQVERHHDPSLRGVPVCVRQHDDVVSVSYEARELGIRKHMSPSRIRAEHPSVRLVHVLVLEAKTSYRQYRAASRLIFDCISSFARDDCIVERHGMDEAFIDVSQRCGAGEDAMSHALALAQQLRSLIAAETGYTCSVGVARNKLMAKLGSRAAKPDGVCGMTPDRVASVLATQRIRDVPGFGGAVAAAVARSAGVEFLHQLAAAPLAALEEALVGTGVTVAQLLAASHGVDDTPVTATGPPKSLQSQCSLSPLVLPDAAATSGRSLEPILPFDAARVRGMMRTLAEDLYARVQEDMEEYARHPTQLVVGLQLYTCKREDIAAAGRVFPCTQLPSASRDALVQHVVELEAKGSATSATRSHVHCIDVLDGAAVHWPCSETAPPRAPGMPPWLKDRLEEAVLPACSRVLAFTGARLQRCAGQPTSRSMPFPVEACGVQAGVSQAACVSVLLEACMRVYERAMHAALVADGWKLIGDSSLQLGTTALYMNVDWNRGSEIYTLPVAVVKLHVAVTTFVAGLPTAPISSYFAPVHSVRGSKRGREPAQESATVRKLPRMDTNLNQPSRHAASAAVADADGDAELAQMQADADRSTTPAIIAVNEGPHVIIDVVSPSVPSMGASVPVISDDSSIASILLRVEQASRVRLTDLLALDAAVGGKLLIASPGVCVQET